MARSRPRSVLPAAWVVLVATAGACDVVLGIEPWSAEPGAGGGGAASSSATGGAGGEARSSSAAEGGGSCDGTACGDPAECVNLASDARHCGACGHSCFADGGCVGGVCGVVTLADETSARYVASTDGHVVWTVGQTGLRSVRKETHAPGPPIDGVQVAALTGSSNLVYFAEPSDGSGNGRVQVVDVAGSAVPRVICDGPRTLASDLRAEGNSVYLVPGGAAAENGVYRCASGASGGEPSPVCLTTSNSNPTQLAFVDAYVLTRITSGSLALCSKSGAGGNATALGGLFTAALAGSPTDLYFADAQASPHAIMRRASAQIVTFDSEEPFHQTNLAVGELHATATHVAWRNNDRVQAVRIAAPGTLVLDEPGTSVVDLALDDDGVYWVQTDGTVKAFAFPLP